MMLYRIFLLFFLLTSVQAQLKAQTDSASSGREETLYSGQQRLTFRDSASLAWYARQDSIRQVQDSLRAVGDSLSMVYIKHPDPLRPNRFIDSLIERYSVKKYDFKEWASRFPAQKQPYEQGKLRKKGESWIIIFVILLLAFFAILRNFFAKELAAIVQAFYSNRVLGQINKEEKFFASWPFVFLYLLFGFTIGLFLYLCGKYFQLSYEYEGFDWFLRLSVYVIALYTLKIFMIKALGFLFDVSKMVQEYVSILYLSYFNAALLFLPVVVAFSLTPGRYAPVYIYLSFLFIAFIYFFQFLRAITNILSGYKFPLMYLIVYLCALEISPILILIKALRF